MDSCAGPDVSELRLAVRERHENLAAQRRTGAASPTPGQGNPERSVGASALSLGVTSAGAVTMPALQLAQHGHRSLAQPDRNEEVVVVHR